MCLKVRIVDVILIATCAILYTQETLFVLVSTVCKELVVVVECYAAKFAARMACESCSLVVVFCSGRLRVAIPDVRFKLLRSI